MDKEAPKNGPLEGLKILDLTRMLPGPYCTMLLADLGAEVIVVEQPSGPALGPRRTNFYIDRNKRSLALNLKDERARQIFYQLASTADVVLEGFRPGVTERLGIDYDNLSRLNERIIYCSLSGYGQNGPDKARAGHDINYLATAGLLHLTATKDAGPVIPGTQVADIGGGSLMAAYSILAALYHRERSGKGQRIDISITDGALALNPIAFLEYFNTGKPPAVQGYRNIGSMPCYNIYRTKDNRHISIGALEPKFWATLCKLIGREDLIAKQNDDSPETISEFRQIFAGKTMAEWNMLLDAEEVCYAPILDLAETCQNRQIIHREMVKEITWPDGGKSKQVGIVPRFSLTPGTIRTRPSFPGQHTEEILKEIGMDPGQIDALEKDGVIVRRS